VVLVLISISIRKIGITLIPALLWMVVARPEARRHVMRLSFPMKIAGGFLEPVVTGIAAWLFLATSMTRSFAMIDTSSAVIAGRAPIDAVSTIVTYRLREFGEIAINLPFPALPQWMRHLLPFAGPTAFTLVLGGLVSRRRQFGVVDIFFISYAAVMLVWPYYDPRFWLPVIPFLIAYIGLSARYCVQKGISAHVFKAWALGFAIVGVPVLISSRMVSFAAASMGDRYYTDRYRATYCAAGYCERGSDSTQAVDPDALQLLRALK
jgi:hypothetical protein